MSPSRRRAPRVGIGIAAATLPLVLVAALSPLVPGVAAMISWPSLDGLLAPDAPVRAAPPSSPGPTLAASPGADSAAYGELLFPLTGPLVEQSGSLAYALLPPGLIDPAVLAPPGSPHLVGSLISDGCGSCHRSHAAQEAGLQASALAASVVCFSCHDGTIGTDVQTAFTNPLFPPNDPTTSSYYVHPAVADVAHAPGVLDEFGGQLNRHSACADCHDPHNANPSLASSAPEGAPWNASGAIAGSTGVQVFNGAAGTAPTYALVRNVASEYQLCFKCHSGWTQLPAQDPARPSTWALDKGIELNPLNGSVHPIEAPGLNATAAMAASLAGGTLWQFSVGSTIRCVNCHGDPSRAVPGTPPGARLTAHASAERGLLIAPYRDRMLKGSAEPYQGTDFTLCYLCHASAPFTAGGTGATNFDLHVRHVSDIAGDGSGGPSTDIDIAGAGQGNAICAECHFRLHSTALAVNPGDVNNARLVNFAPNVVANGGTLQWTGAGSPTCTLTCHGVTHRAAGYAPAAEQNTALGVDARISIGESGNVLIGRPRTFTVTVEKNDGTGGGWSPAAGVSVSTVHSGVGIIDTDASTCDDQATDGSGQCLVVVVSAEFGQAAVDATATVAVEGVLGPILVGVSSTGHGAFAISNVATWVDARISIGSSTTALTIDPITFSVTVEMNLGLGGGWVPAEGVTVAVSEAGDGSIDPALGTCDDAPTDSAGQCTVTLTTTVAGTSSVDATATVGVGGAPIGVSTIGYGAFSVSNVATWVDTLP